METKGAVLITGAAKRLGRAMAEDLAAQGYHIAVHYGKSEDVAERFADELREKYNIRAVALAADLTKRDDVSQVVKNSADALGQNLTGLINNASAFIFDRIDEVEPDAFEIWDQNFRTNLEAPYFLMRDFAAQCQGEGWIVNMIDQRVLRLTPNYGSYTVAKTSLYNLTKTAAMALAPHIRVNAIGPGTTLQGAHQTKDSFEHQRKISILERGADVEDILQAMNYLKNARAVTGQMIAVDGGQHLIWQLPNP